ncbi:hypothetical protein [Sphingobacterium mizutaii]|uniref:hypothetical protein n=1 Tax=Sphingobacterium mizutaii TaxID=1010 RepID=UPI0016238263|nr:hypothetical protein [Sphingobacterium mizutaii]
MVGDGFKYRRGGAHQGTGGFDYKSCEDQRFYDNLDLIETAEIYFPISLKEFDSRLLLALATDYSRSSILAVR